MKHGVIIPLIGGMSIGASKALDEAPSWAISWSDFKTNEENFKEYYTSRLQLELIYKCNTPKYNFHF